jgi:hypothetical protein
MKWEKVYKVYRFIKKKEKAVSQAFSFFMDGLQPFFVAG